MLINPVAVEKLAHQEFAEIASRQEALQTIFPSLLDIFYHPIFNFFQKNRCYLVTAVGIAAIAACLAEVASQFREAGGPYLYTRVSFGPFAAIQIGWLTWLTRIVASAAAADLFVSYLGQFFPAVEAWAVRAMVLGMLIGR
jgi:Amino acid permease